MNPQSEKLANLLRRAQQGDQAALHLLCREIGSILTPYFRSRFRDTDTVNDLVQDTYMRLLKSFGKIEDPMKLKNFVLKIAFHVMQDHLRQKYRKSEESYNDALEQQDAVARSSSTSGSLYGGEPLIEKMDLDKAMRQLPEKTQQVLAMMADGFKYEEIATAMQLSVSGVKMQVNRGLKKLRTSLFGVTFLIAASTYYLVTEMLI